MLDAETKRGINAARDTLVGQVPDPLGQVRHITAALMHRFMSDRDRVSVESGGKPAFFIGEFARFGWGSILDPKIGGHERVELYREAVEQMSENPNLPEVFRAMFRGAFLAFNDPQTLALFLREVDALPVRDGEDLGNAFEHILSILGTQGQAGQFRTPRHIIEFITEVVAPRKGERILDPACGSAGFLIAAHRRILRENSSGFRPNKHRFAFAANGENAAETDYANGRFKGDKLAAPEIRKLAQNVRGYDISPDMVRLSLVNMFLHGIPAPQIHQYDALTSRDKWDDDFEVILANPPFMTPKGGIRPHGQFAVQSSRSEVLFADYILQHLTSKGRAGIIVPEGIIFQSGRAHKALRKNLVENGLHAVVSLPNGIFNPYSGVKTSILFVDRRRARSRDEILFVRVENDGYDLGAQRRRIDENDLPAAFELLREWNCGSQAASSPLAHLRVKREAIADDGEYNLSAERYRPSVTRSGAKSERVKLGEVCEIVRDKPSSFSGEKRYYDTGAIGAGMRGKCKLVSFKNRPSRADILPQKGDAGFAAMKNTAKVVLIDDFYNGAIFSTGFHFLRPSEKILPAFLFHLFADERFQQDKDRVAVDGIMGGIRKSDVAKLKIPLPPLEFQRELVAELDGYQRVIDGARQAAESWRPRVPANPEWPLVKLGEVASVVAGQSPVGSSYNKKAEGVPFHQGKKEFSDMYIGSPAMWTTQATKMAEKGDILMSVRAPVGPVNINIGKICIGRGLAAIRAKPRKANQFFLFYALRSMEKNIRGNEGATISSIPQRQIEALPIVLPPLEVQREIVSHLESERSRVESCRALAESHAEKVRERMGEVWGD